MPSDDDPEGMIFQLLQRVTGEAKDMMQYWLVCDGPLELNKMEVLKELLCGDGSVSLNTGHKLTPNGMVGYSHANTIDCYRFISTVIGDR